MRPCNNLINTPPTLGSKGSEKTTEGRHPLGFLLSGPGAILSGRQSPPGGPDSASRFPRRYTLTFIALLAALTLGLLFLLPGGLLQAQDNGPIMYPENGMGPVATYTAVDPEMTAITSWSLASTDAGVFDIAGGVLSFKKSPDFEMAADVDGTSPSTATAMDNVYEVTVQAMDSTGKTGMKMVEVMVTDVDEPGMVTLSALQPQAGTALTATNSDPDGIVSNLKWQWAKSMTMDGTYEDIDKAISGPYTPKDADIDYYLQVTASYTDPEGEGKTAMATSAYAVQGLRSDNNSPEFADDQDPDTEGPQMDAAREVAENTPAGSAIGDPVVAEDEDGDILTYTLTGTDAADFDIDRATGQIMTKAALDKEDPAGSTKTVIVRATDPAGEPDLDTGVPANSAEVTVIITITDVNEPPAIVGDAAVTFEEEQGDIANRLGTRYEEDNPEDNIDSTWSVAGADGSKFNIGNQTDGIPGELKFKAKPDYEMPTDANTDNVYEVTVRAADAVGNIGTMAVKVTVTNEDEEGTVTLSKTQPRVGIAVTASLTDPDGSISGLTWQWYDGVIGEDNAIDGANSDTYTPVADDFDMTLMAEASYTDGEGDDKSASGASTKMVAVDTRNRAPVFEDQDTEADGVQNTETTRKVEENAEALATDDAAEDANDVASDNVGGVVMAEDPDPNADALTYTLGGTDASKFRVRGNGQIEVGAGTKLDYETKTTYMVTVMAEDSFGDSASIMVTITVTDVNEGPDITGEDTIEYPENRASSVETYRASDPERAGTITWSLSGDDADLFDISTNGALTFKKSPDYEMKADDDTDSMYEVTVQATDADRNTGTKPVTVEVTNVDEPGVVTLSARQPMAGVLLTATITDPDGDASNFEWQWQKGSSNIPGANMETYTPLDSDRGSYLRATVTYKDPESRQTTKRANVRSDYMVLRPASDNNVPKFAADQDPVMVDDQADAKREIAENTEAGENIGARVVATDADSGQKLTYTLMTGTDADSFAIDRATGQLKTKAALNEETENSYTVTVRATDPAGASDTVDVDITVTDVNEPPVIAGDATVTFNEDTGDVAVALVSYMVTDPEEAIFGLDDPDPWSVAGADSSKFTIVGGDLKFKDKPDYEKPTDANKDNVYEVTVRAADADGYIGLKAVKVTVENVDEVGVVTLSKTQPRVGIAVTASVTDPDGNISGLTWQWEISGANPDNGITATEPGDIAGATSDTYTPKAGDFRGTLMATASYFDGQSAPDASKKTAMKGADNAVVADTRNRAPVFEDQDTEADGVQNTETTRKVEENAVAVDDSTTDDSADDNVGRPATANDPDPNADDLTYTLSGADADSFTVKDNGQIEVGAGTKLDYETKQTYMVTVLAEDSYGDSASIMVTIMVTDMDEAPEIMRTPDANVAPEFASARTSRTVAENTAAGEDIGNPVAANDANRDTLSYTLGGADAASFNIDSATGQLMTLAALDYETKPTYSVTVTASESGGGLSASIDAMVMVTNVDEMGEVTLWAGMDALTMAPQVGDTITGAVMDPDGGVTGETWQWSRTMDTADMTSWMDIQDATDAAYMVTAGDAGYYLRVMATYTDAAGTGMGSSPATMMVVGANVAPEFASATTSRTVAENTAAGEDIGTPVAATDNNGDTLAYTLGGADAASFNIDPDTGQLMTLAALDYETKDTYSVTVAASDSGGLTDSIDAMVMVTNVDEMGEVTLWAGMDALTMAPQVGDTITGAVMDPDGNPGDMPPIAMDTTINDVTWQWSRTTDTADMNSWMDIQDATDAAYMVTAGDAGYYLRVMATYTDAAGTDMEHSMPTMMVGAEAGDTLLDRYDADNNGQIDRPEVLGAIRDFVFNQTIEREDVVAVIRLFVFRR